MMKKILMVITLCLVLLTGCSKKEEAMTIFPAGFTRKETDLLELLGRTDDCNIYDFLLDDSVKSMDIVVWKLEGKEWTEHHSLHRQFVDQRGRLCFEFDNIYEGITIALQSDTNSGHTELTGDEKSYRLNVITSFLEEKRSFEYGETIPVAVQIATSKNMITTYNVDSFHTPGEYSREGYEEVYAITVKFENK